MKYAARNSSKGYFGKNTVQGVVKKLHGQKELSKRGVNRNVYCGVGSQEKG